MYSWINKSKMFTHLLMSVAIISSAQSREGWDNDDMHEFLKHPSDFLSDPSEEEMVDWKGYGKRRLEEAIESYEKLHLLHKPAKNIILMMGDGMGISTLTAARIYLAQTRNLTGEEARLSWENMPFAALSKVYSANNLIPDSAAAATAMLSGEKTNSGVVGCNQLTQVGNCSSQQGNEIMSVLHHAIDEGKWTGIVTTTRLTHASPASVYAHAADRDWEADSDMPDEALGMCPDIASQLIDDERNKQIRVFLGGGRSKFLPDTTTDPEYPHVGGDREDGRDLTHEWLNQKMSLGLHDSKYAYVTNQSGFDAADPTEVDYLFGLFEPSHMHFELDRISPSSAEGQGEPSLVEMVEKSIKILEKSDKGYYLFIEGGRIDHAHHHNNAQRALGDTVALSDAVQRALDLTKEEETLVIVAADHSHTMTINGYMAINGDILGYDDAQRDENDKVYSSLSYINGPGFMLHRTANDSLLAIEPRMDLELLDTEQIDHVDFIQDAAIPKTSETHAGEDVAVFARGPMAHMFMGTHEQSYIGNLMMFAFCVGENKDFCENMEEFETCSATAMSTSLILLTVILFSKYVMFGNN